MLCIGLLCLTETASAGTVYYNGWVVYNASLPTRVRFDWTAVEITGEGLLTDDSNTELGVLLQESQVVGNVYQVFVDGVEQPRLNTTSATAVPFSFFFFFLTKTDVLTLFGSCLLLFLVVCPGIRPESWRTHCSTQKAD